MKKEIFKLFQQNLELRKAVARFFDSSHETIRLQAYRNSVRLSDYRVIAILRRFYPELTDEDIFEPMYINLMSK